MCAAYVYITANKPHGTLYIGSTTNLLTRIWEHKNKLREGFTKNYSVDQLVYFEEHASILEAAKREKQLKNWRREWKISLIKKSNPQWEDLFMNINQ